MTTLPSGDQPKRKRKGSWPGKRKEENHEEMKPFLDSDSRRREMEEGGNSEKGESKKMNRKTVPGVILRCPAFQECQEIQKITVLKRFNSRKLPHLIVVENIAVFYFILYLFYCFVLALFSFFFVFAIGRYQKIHL